MQVERIPVWILRKILRFGDVSVWVLEWAEKHDTLNPAPD